MFCLIKSSLIINNGLGYVILILSNLSKLQIITSGCYWGSSNWDLSYCSQCGHSSGVYLSECQFTRTSHHFWLFVSVVGSSDPLSICSQTIYWNTLHIDTVNAVIFVKSHLYRRHKCISQLFNYRDNTVPFKALVFVLLYYSFLLANIFFWNILYFWLIYVVSLY